jgi:hypothetical protein
MEATPTDWRRRIGVSGLLFAGAMTACTDVRHTLVNAASPDYPETEEAQKLVPVFDGLDAERAQIAVQLFAVASGFSRITALVHGSV